MNLKTEPYSDKDIGKINRSFFYSNIFKKVKLGGLHT